MNTRHPIALITGVNRGLGRSMALALAAAGTDIVGTYRTHRDEANRLVADVEAAGRRAVVLPLDVGDSATLPAFVEAVRAALTTTFGRDAFDYLVNNAGTGLHKPLVDTSEADFDELMRVHLKAPFFLAQRLAPLIADGGRIVNVSSGLARFAMPGSSAYAVMKGGVEVLTRYLAKELAPRGITANTIAPGAIATDFRGGAIRDNPEARKMIASITALGRVGEPDDIGGAVAALLAPGSGWIDGQRIEASGGMLL